MYYIIYGLSFLAINNLPLKFASNILVSLLLSLTFEVEFYDSLQHFPNRGHVIESFLYIKMIYVTQLYDYFSRAIICLIGYL